MLKFLPTRSLRKRTEVIDERMDRAIKAVEDYIGAAYGRHDGKLQMTDVQRGLQDIALGIECVF